MQGFGYSDAASDIQLTDEEAKALVALHARRHEARQQPNLCELAAALNISDAEAMALLTELRAQNPARTITPPIPSAVIDTRHTNSQRLPAYVWLVVAGVVLFWCVVGGLLRMSRGTSIIDATPTESATETASATKAAAAPDGTTASTGGSKVVISGGGTNPVEVREHYTDRPDPIPSTGN